jgi:hypothetical protein
MAIDENREQPRILHAFGDENGWSLRVVEHARGKSERSERWPHVLVEITPQLGGAFGLLAGAGDGDPAAQIGKKFPAVEAGMCTRDRGGPAHVLPLTAAACLKAAMAQTTVRAIVPVASDSGKEG